jgi:hypothetical protein
VFVPKRDVLIEIEDITKNVQKKLDNNCKLDEFNERLENIYNVNGPEKLKYLRHYFYYDDVKKKEIPEIE